MAMMTSLVSQLLVEKCRETPSIEVGHIDPNKEEKKPEME
jgi:hypothetical protein